MAVKQGTDRLKDLPLPPDVLTYVPKPAGTIEMHMGDGLAPVTIPPGDPDTGGKGRPEIYSPAIAARIIEQVRVGLTPTEVCKQPWAPSIAVYYRWQAEKPDFQEAVRRARALGAEPMVDRAIDIADTVDIENKVAVQKARLQVDARFRLASVYDRRFSDRQIVTHEHENSGQVADMSTKELGAIALQLQQLLTKATAIDVESEPVVQEQAPDKQKTKP
jgi:hypothetical protein